MPYCELCTKKPATISAIVESAVLNICNDCSKYGEVIEIIKPKTREIKKQPQAQEEFTLIIKDYSSKIKKARERLNLTQEKLARAIAEKESVIHQIESNKLTPSIRLARKLEQFLKISLIETYEETENKKINFKDESITIGDILKDD